MTLVIEFEYIISHKLFTYKFYFLIIFLGLIGMSIYTWTSITKIYTSKHVLKKKFQVESFSTILHFFEKRIYIILFIQKYIKYFANIKVFMYSLI